MAAKKKTAKPKSRQAESPPPEPTKAQGEDAKRSVGRPSKFTQEIADAFCEHIADGCTARDALEKIGNAVGWTTIKRWLQDDEDFRSQYARAREDQADHDADEIRDIQRRVIGPVKEGETALGHQEARLAIDTLKWLASKRAPKKYGSDLDLTEDDGTVTIQIVRFSKSAGGGK